MYAFSERKPFTFLILEYHLSKFLKLFIKNEKYSYIYIYILLSIKKSKVTIYKI